MTEYSYILKGAMVYPAGKVLDIAIRDGKIAALEENIEINTADEWLDLKGKLVTPAFVDSHMHIDKALLAQEDNTTDLLSACIRSTENIIRDYSGLSKAQILDDILKRTDEIIHMCVVNGTTAIKTNILLSDIWEWTAFEAMQIQKEKYKDMIDIYNVTGFGPLIEDKWRAAAAKGEIDFIGGCPNIIFDTELHRHTYTNNFKPYVDLVFSLAKEYDLPIDLHCDESDSPDISLFLYIMDKTYELGMEGRVTCGHVTGLNARGMQEDTAMFAVAKCAKTHVNVTSLTSCNLYLMGLDRRGPTRVRQLQDAGVCVSIASDNIRDAFRPFGNADLLEEALLTANVHKFCTKKDMNRIMSMITYHPAENTLMKDYGILPGCSADLVVLDADNVQEAILSQVDKLYVFKKGRIVAKSGCLIAKEV